MILIIDNYDSFTYNLYQMAGAICPEIIVVRNDQITIPEIKKLDPRKIIISPGPGHPQNAGILVELVRNIDHNIPLLGICLGHQGIGFAYGAEIMKAPQPVHGKKSDIKLHPGCPLFNNLGSELEVGRYHSLIIDPATLPDSFRITAESEDKIIMGIAHRELPLYGLQFHPESILTEKGGQIINNFLNL